VGYVLLIVHAFQDDDTLSGVLMILQFIIPCLGLYTLYYIITKWDGSLGFKLSLCGYLGAVLYVVLSIATGTL
jgi:hypothetical protein